MAGHLQLRSGAPAVGLTKVNKYSSLHGRSPQPDKTRKPSPPIHASPRGSSSDEEFDVQQVPDDGVSDDSKFGGVEEKKKLNIHATLNSSTESNSAKGEDGQKRGLSVEPSNIRAGNFTSGIGPRSRNGLQNSQKRKDAEEDDDDVPFQYSQKKRPRQSYGYGSANINRGSVKKPGTPTKKSFKESDKARPSFRGPDTVDGMLARGRTSLRIGTSSGNTPDLE